MIEEKKYLDLEGLKVLVDELKTQKCNCETATVEEILELFKEEEAKSLVITANTPSEVGLSRLSTNQILEYSLDNQIWINMDTSTNVSLNDGEKMYVRGVLSSANALTKYTRFLITGNVSLSGNINYVWNKDDPDNALKIYCGNAMFMNCQGITDASKLKFPATNLLVYCYGQMFKGCSSLTKAPELPATKLATDCYNSMFSGCTNLNYIKCLAENISSSNCTNNWVSGVASIGTFVKSPNMNDWNIGTNGIPEGWTIKEI